jgi:hypothetical protein
MSHTTGWIAGEAGEALAAMEVTPPAAAATTAAAAMPVTRVLRITAVLSTGPTQHEVNSVAGVSNSYTAHND